VTLRAPLAALLVTTAAAAGCVYYNGLFNAEAAFRRAESARLGGAPDSALTGYAAAIEGAERAWRAEPAGPYAARALLLAARASLRHGEPGRARADLARLAALPAVDTLVAARADVLRGALLVLEQRPGEGLATLESAALPADDAEWRAEAWLWRARALDASGRFDEAWAAWDFAAVNEPGLRWSLEAERAGRAVDRDRASEASVSLGKLLDGRRGEAWVDTVLAVVERADRRWGPAVAAELLEPARLDRWGPEARDRVLLRQVELLLAGGDTVGADETLAWVAEGTTDAAPRARIELARLRLSRAGAFADLVPVRRLLLPITGHEAAEGLLVSMAETEVLAQWGTEGDVLAWFAAGEIARDALEARRLAAALFLTAAESDLQGEWTGKSLLAALTVSTEGELRERIRQRALGTRLDPWVERLRPGYVESGELERRDDELDRRVRDLRLRAAEESRRLLALTSTTDDA